MLIFRVSACLSVKNRLFVLFLRALVLVREVNDIPIIYHPSEYILFHSFAFVAKRFND